MLGNPFKIRSHYVFDYKPRYYDPRKERLEKLKKKYQNKDTTDSSKYVLSLTKNSLKENWKKSKNNTRQERQTIIRLALIISILIGIVAYIFQIHTLF